MRKQVFNLKNQIITFILMGVFAFSSIFSFAFADGDGSASLDKPVIKMIGATIKGDSDHFELTMQATPSSEGFQSAAIVLQYDADIITPVNWDGTDALSGTYTGWDDADIVEAAGTMKISNKTALAYETTDADGKKTGYIYMYAESAVHMAGADGLPSDGKLMTVRFKYVGDGKDKVTAKDGSDAYLFGKVSLADGGVIELAPYKVAAASPSEEQAKYCADLINEYYYSQPEQALTESVGLTYNYPMDAPTFDLLLDQETANTGGTEKQYVAVVFYDWDESTILGSIAVPTGTDVSEQITEFENTIKDKLTDKKGYDFAAWVDYDADVGACYGKSVVKSTFDETLAAVEAAIDNLRGGDGKESSIVDFSSGITKSAIVKAVYKPNAELDLTNTDYTTEIVGWERFAQNSNNYLLTVKVKRENTDGKGVPRIAEPAIRVVMTTDAGVALYSLINLENKDETTAELIPNYKIATVSRIVIDNYNVANWTTTPGQSANLEENQTTDAESATGFDYNNDADYANAGFFVKGNVGMINSAVKPGGTLTNINATILNSIGIDPKDPSTGKNFNAANLRNYIKAAWEEKQGNLTYAEIQYAIKNAGALMP